MKENDYSIKMLIGALVPLAIFLLAALNSYLMRIGAPCINIGDETVSEIVTNIVMYAAAFFSWWKNNNVTRNAQEAQKVLNGLKSGDIDEVIIEEVEENK